MLFSTSGAFDDIANRIKQRGTSNTVPGEEELKLFELQPTDANTAVCRNSYLFYNRELKFKRSSMLQ